MAEAANVNNKPMIVHCSAGVGRSGTFCAVHSAIKKLRSEINRDETKEQISLNLIDLILHMRSQRPGMVQTKVSTKRTFESKKKSQNQISKI